MVEKEVLRRRIDKLNEYLEVLDRAKEYTREEFLADPERYGSAERFLQLSIEALTDMGSHVATDEDLGSFEHAADVPDLLREHGYVEADLGRRWKEMIRFRNVLVHEYVDIDRHLVYDVLQNELDDLRRLRKVFAEFL
jgi:uncharacterized protein YutE (UPF0331/DUF86 family)